MLGQAISFAVAIHTGQKREDKSPYILHPLRIMMKMNTKLEMIVAILHDTVEDGGPNVLEEIRRIFKRALGVESDIVVNAVDCLSKRKGEDYLDYIERVMSNDLARRIKIADIEDNINALEIPKLTAEHLKRIDKYHKVYMKLKAV